ncbi:amino acid ABC transporter permease [Uliginosibacterium sp. 31-16]|uniref:amino acid ABC transporter permease n=1 Tax=Uliginosibacterium sp. 31-16 TaxID=3068315 RepID=UPI00273E2D19|nr:amino acid ABC transporter permease [Uliginosibacterium sp. 31-16]MDP5240797.1 amino acid ABC transporter permease [Uliginosibacterium sp. 31-16]
MIRFPRKRTIFWTLLAGALLWPIFSWAVLHAIWGADLEACRAARGVGACWGVIVEKHRLLFFGRYPFAEQWRPLIATLLIVAVLGLATWRRLWQPRFAVLALITLSIATLLMLGGLASLSFVPTKLWGGLPLTLLISLGSTLLAFPFAILLALGRRSRLPLLRQLCTLYIELVRGVPLISLLFMAAFLFPLLLPAQWRPDILPRVVFTIAAFAAAYLAEVIRGGLQAVPSGQYTAALAIGMTWWQATRHIVLPQALRTALPALVNSFVGIFKDSSLISIVSLHELTGALAISLGGDAEWRSFYLEGYLFIALIYWIFCYALSCSARRLESGLRY